MSAANDGGPAFPCMTFAGDDHNGPEYSNGMSLRDYFAGQALAASDWSNWDTGAMYQDRIVQRCYALADAMLAERAKGGGSK